MNILQNNYGSSYFNSDNSISIPLPNKIEDLIKRTVSKDDLKQLKKNQEKNIDSLKK